MIDPISKIKESAPTPTELAQTTAELAQTTAKRVDKAPRYILTAVIASAFVAVLLFAAVNDFSDAENSGECGDNVTWYLDETTGTLTISGTGNMYGYPGDGPFTKSKVPIITVIIADGVTSIGMGAFDSCTSLESVTIPDSVKLIDLGAFYNCTSLRSITLPDTIGEIWNYTFFGCASLRSITIPDSVTMLANHAFEGCASLESVTLSASIGSVGDDAFKGCASLRSITIPDSVTWIGSDAFQGCTSLESVTLPDTLESIQYYAFSDCTSLKSITIPDSVTNIDGDAFRNCTSLTSIDIGNCSNIDPNAFPSHTFFKENGKTPITVGSPDFIGHKFRGQSIYKMTRNDKADAMLNVTYGIGGVSLPPLDNPGVEIGGAFTVATYAGTKTGYTSGGWS